MNLPQTAVGVCLSLYLLLGQPPLDLLVLTDAVGDWSGELGLDPRQPGAQVTHVLVQLLHRHQRLPQLLHPERHTSTREDTGCLSYM